MFEICSCGPEVKPVTRGRRLNITRAYIDTISHRTQGSAAGIWRSALGQSWPAGLVGHQSQLTGIGRAGLSAVAVAGVARTAFTCHMVIHLGIQGALHQHLLQCVEQSTLHQRGASIAASQQLIQKFIRYRMFSASRHIRAHSFPFCPPTHESADTAHGGSRGNRVGDCTAHQRSYRLGFTPNAHGCVLDAADGAARQRCASGGRGGEPSVSAWPGTNARPRHNRPGRSAP